MTAHNTQDRIGPAIESLLAQSWRNLEVVVADDASTDGTADVVQALAERDTRVRYLRMPHNAGTYAAKTAAFGQSTGAFVTCHDSDDWSHPLRLEWQIRPLLAHPKRVATTSRWVRLTDEGQFHARSVYPLTRLNPASPLFRRQAVEQHAGLWDTVRTGADSEFLARLKLVFGRQSVQALAVPLAFGAHRPGSLMTATDTGHGVHGLSPSRLSYWEAWTRWHIATLRAGGKPVMPRSQSDRETPRPFAFP
jgi:glycosyltransferase involved in cell wall biosynthesis